MMACIRRVRSGSYWRPTTCGPGWVPNRPMLLMASPDDDCVPYGNSVKAYNEFMNAGAGDLITFRDIGRPGDGITHVQGAILGIPQAIIWLKDTCPKD